MVGVAGRRYWDDAENKCMNVEDMLLRPLINWVISINY